MRRNALRLLHPTRLTNYAPSSQLCGIHMLWICTNWQVNWNALAAVGTLLAIFTAIGVPIWQRHLSTKDQKKLEALRSKILAIQLADTIIEIASKSEVMKSLLPNMDAYAMHASAKETANALRLDAGDRLQQGIAYEALPETLATSIAALAMSCRAHNSFIDQASSIGFHEVDRHAFLETHRIAESLKQVQTSLLRVAGELAVFEPALAGVKNLVGQNT